MRSTNCDSEIALIMNGLQMSKRWKSFQGRPQVQRMNTSRRIRQVQNTVKGDNFADDGFRSSELRSAAKGMLHRQAALQKPDPANLRIRNILVEIDIVDTLME